mmetsp:Transcript_18288/g.52802  ORF Transcript_18288/g.52802 Transcript_18288/m.52802 type:complete len:232 (-) Transcript_18288:179-874(-)
MPTAAFPTDRTRFTRTPNIVTRSASLSPPIMRMGDISSSVGACLTMPRRRLLIRDSALFTSRRPASKRDRTVEVMANSAKFVWEIRPVRSSAGPSVARAAKAIRAGRRRVRNRTRPSAPFGGAATSCWCVSFSSWEWWWWEWEWPKCIDILPLRDRRAACRISTVGRRGLLGCTLPAKDDRAWKAADGALSAHKEMTILGEKANMVTGSQYLHAREAGFVFAACCPPPLCV